MNWRETPGLQVVIVMLFNAQLESAFLAPALRFKEIAQYFLQTGK